MPPLAIVFGALGVIVIVVGLMSSRFGLPAGARVGGIIVGVMLLVAAAAVFAMGSPEATSPEEAESGAATSSTPTAAAEATTESDAEQKDLPVVEPTATPENIGDLVVFHEDGTAVANFDGIRFMGLTAYGPQDPPFKLNQEVYLEFTLQNLRKGPIVLEKGFVAALSPRDDDEVIDFGAVHEGVEVARFQEFKVGVLVKLSEPGVWTLWPCYALISDDDTLRNRCTPKWRGFEVTVEE